MFTETLIQQVRAVFIPFWTKITTFISYIKVKHGNIFLEFDEFGPACKTPAKQQQQKYIHAILPK